MAKGKFLLTGWVTQTETTFWESACAYEGAILKLL